MGKEDGVFEILQVVILNGKLALQGAIGDAAVLVQHGDRLAEDFVERHGSSSACRIAPRCASTAAYHTRTPAAAPCEEFPLPPAELQQEKKSITPVVELGGVINLHFPSFYRTFAVI